MSDGKKISFQNAKFGTVEIGIDDVIEFPRGVPGFELCKRFGLLGLEEEVPFLRLLSLEEPSVGFVLVDPKLIWPDYKPGIGSEDLQTLEIESDEDAVLYVVITLSPNPKEVTANLKGPVLINRRTRKAGQIILIDESYQTKHPILPEGRQ